MKLYFAPLEGITNYIFRNTHKAMFAGCDEYYAPFITPSDNEKVNRKGLKDLVEENNAGISVKPQILTNNADAFLSFVPKIKAIGYGEVNLNFGCPSQTVVKKGKGSGFLKTPELVDEFLYKIFEKADIKISVKTRTGFTSSDEMDALTEIYNKYPISMLIIHPRTRSDFYGGKADLDVFERAYEKSKNIVCYNGDIETEDDYEKITSRFPRLEHIMIGRGAVKNAKLFAEIRGEQKVTTEEIVEFTRLLAQNYQSELKSEVFTLNKLKEVWMYMIQNYPEEKRVFKAIRKAGKLTDFFAAIEELQHK